MAATFEARDGPVNRLADTPSLGDASALLPAGGYSTLRTYDGDRVLRLGDHCRRLEASAGAPLDDDRLRRAVAGALRATGHPESRLRVTFAPPRLFVSVEPFESLPARLYEEGVACATLPLRRENPHAKDTRFIATAQQAQATLPPGVHEGLMVAEDGAILEGLTSNFFALRDGSLRTEDARVLPGVSRALVLDLADGLVPVVREAVQASDLGGVAEAFLTSVSREVLPVVRIDGHALGTGRPGPVTRELMRRFAAFVAREARRV